jgi:hypothetical protein
MMLTETQRRAFAEEGHLVLRDLFASEIVDQLRSDADTVLHNALSAMTTAQAQDLRVTWWRLASGRPYVLKIKPVLDLASSAARLAHGAELRGVVADLLGVEPQLVEDKFMYKQVVDAATDWADLPTLGEEVCKHTDAAYFQARGYERVVTVAVCLDECTAEAGALKVWPGSHQRVVEQVDTANQGPVVPDHAAPDSTAVTLEAHPGSVLAWDARLVHASGPNTSGNPRRLLVLGYAPTGSGGR